MLKALWSRSFFPVLVTYFIDNFGLAIVYPIFTPLFLEPERNLLPAELTLFHRTFLLGLLIASFPLAQFFGAPLIGGLSDRIGRRKVFIGTILGGIIGYTLTGFGIHFRDLHFLWIGRVITGFFAGNQSLCLAAIADISVTDASRARNFGWVGTINGVSFILAILIGGSLVNPNLTNFFRPDLPFFITAALAVISLGLIIGFFQESHKPMKHEDRLHILQGLKNIGAALKTEGVRTIYGGYFLFMICWITSMQFLSAYLYSTFFITANIITFSFVTIGVMWSFANFVVNPFLSKIWPTAKTFIFALICISIFLYITLIPVKNLYFFLTFFFLATFCSALGWTNGLVTISLSVSKFIQGSILGINQSIVAIASILGPILGGLIAGMDIHKLYLFTGSCSLLAALLLIIFKRELFTNR